MRFSSNVTSTSQYCIMIFQYLERLLRILNSMSSVTYHIPLQDKISTSNAIVVESLITGEAKGYEHEGTAKPKNEFEIKCDVLLLQLKEKTSENALLTDRIAQLELVVSQLEGQNQGVRGKLKDAQLTDNVVNGA